MIRDGLEVRKQYNVWPSGQGLDAWDVDRIIRLSRGLPIHDVPSMRLPRSTLITGCWLRYGPIVPTIRRVVEHMRLTTDVDLSCPIILAASGRVMDGVHRVARAILDGHLTIKAVQFVTDPDPTTGTAQ